VSDPTICPKCHRKKECLGGRSAHYSNWICINPDCKLAVKLPAIDAKDAKIAELETSRDTWRDNCQTILDAHTKLLTEKTQLEQDKADLRAILHRVTTERNELEQRLAEAERDAKRWNAFINCARIRVYGWAGADMEGNKKPGDNYVHFGADFWTNHHTSAVTDPIAKTLITTFADSAIDAAIGVKP